MNDMEELMKKPLLQLVKLFLIAALLFITPLLSTSLRYTYLYFILNILILLVSAESGLLTFFLDSPENTKPAIIADHDHKQNTDKVEAAAVVKVKKSPSTPSIFFIEAEDDAGIVDDEEEEEGGEMGEENGQELFQKAEMFIGNFYKQLKMQREGSLNQLASSSLSENILLEFAF